MLPWVEFDQQLGVFGDRNDDAVFPQDWVAANAWREVGEESGPGGVICDVEQTHE